MLAAGLYGGVSSGLLQEKPGSFLQLLLPGLSLLWGEEREERAGQLEKRLAAQVTLIHLVHTVPITAEDQ